MKQTMIVLLALSAFAGEAAAADAAKPCVDNYKQEGSFFAGRQFSTWEVVPGVTIEQAYKRIYVDVVKSGLKVVTADKEMGMISAEQNQMSSGTQVSLPWNVLLEESAGGVKVNVSKMTPSGYATGRDYQMESMCAVVDSARG